MLAFIGGTEIYAIDDSAVVEEVEIRQALAVSMLTPDSALSEQQRHWLDGSQAIKP